MIRCTTWGLCALVIVGCNPGGAQVPIPALDRSDKIQLFCADIENPTSFDFDFRSLLPLEACGIETTADGFDPNGFGAATQIQTGEVTAINFTNRFIVDTNPTIPGVTGFLVGEQPTGIRISPLNPRFTYVASFSPKTIQAYDTREILGQDDADLPAGDPIVEVPEKVLDAGPVDLAMYEMVDAPVQSGNPVNMVVAGDVQARWLYAPIPDLGQIAQIRWDPDSNTLGDPTYVDLPDVTCDTLPPPPPPPESTESDYHRICPDTGPEARDVKTVQTTQPCVDGTGTGAKPVAVVIDYGTDSPLDDFLLVADANQPIIHRFSLSAANGIENPSTPDEIVSNTPTRDIATTPFVPADVDNKDATQRYLYAISATDGSVLAIDYTPAAPDFGQVLPVLAGVSIRANEENVESRNRVRSLFANARSIEVVTPDYELNEDRSVPDGELCNPLDSDDLARAQNATNMRGVFLAINLANGTLIFLDIYDLNATCRGGFASSSAVGCNSITEPDSFASIRRHRRRWGFTPSSFIEIQGTPALVFNASQGSLDDDTGAPRNSDGPGLNFIECPESMFNVFGAATGTDDGLICASSQVWSSFSQRWDSTWGGLIPGSEGGLGLFSDGPSPGVVVEGENWFLAGDVPFCGVGVLGGQIFGEPTELPGADPDTGLDNTVYAGDRLLITGEVPPDRLDDGACEKFLDVPDEIDDSPVWFPIIRAFDDKLQIGESPRPQRYTLDEVKFCYHQFTEYQIHTRSVYTVVGSESGFIHRTVPSDNPLNLGECILDPTRPITAPDGVLDVDTVLSGRAFRDTQFINPLVSFEIQAFSDEVAINDSTVAILTFNIFNGFNILFLDTSSGLPSLPASMLFSETFDQLFLVDLQRGVRQIVFDPLGSLQAFQ